MLIAIHKYLKVRLLDIKSPILSKSVQGKLSAKSYEIGSLILQSGLETAVQTHQLFSKSNLLDMEYNCIEVFQKEEDGNGMLFVQSGQFYVRWRRTSVTLRTSLNVVQTIKML